MIVLRDLLNCVIVMAVALMIGISFEDDEVSSLASTSRVPLTRINKSPQPTVSVTVNGVEWSNDGETLFVQSRVGIGAYRSLSFYRVSNGEQQVPLWATCLQKSVLHASVSGNAEKVAVVTSAGEVLWIDVEASAAKPLRLIAGCFFGMTAIDHDGGMVACVTLADTGEHVYLWNPKSDVVKQLSMPPGRVGKVQFSPDGDFLLGALTDGSVQVWEVTTGVLVDEIRGHGYLPAASFVDRENRILSVCGEGQLRISSAVALPCRVETRVRHSGFSVRGTPLSGGMRSGPSGETSTYCGSHGTAMSNGVASLAVNRQGILAAWVERGSSRIILWDLEKQAVKLEIENPAVVLDLKFSPDGTSLAVAGIEATIRIYDAGIGCETQTINVAEM
ncbi:MAG: repeat-like protein [Schlesneria sp.]|nr:repeat-like protein [Schlesneria sp.]